MHIDVAALNLGLPAAADCIMHGMLHATDCFESSLAGVDRRADAPQQNLSQTVCSYHQLAL
jgi:hypothetical protein